MTIVGIIAFKIAWDFVHQLYDWGIISGSNSGSFIHWSVRTIAFIVVFYIFSLIIWLTKFIYTYSNIKLMFWQQLKCRYLPFWCRRERRYVFRSRSCGTNFSRRIRRTACRGWCNYRICTCHSVCTIRIWNWYLQGGGWSGCRNNRSVPQNAYGDQIGTPITDWALSEHQSWFCKRIESTWQYGDLADRQLCSAAFNS